MLKVYAYNAGKGDCIRIQYGDGHNIIVDSGVRRFGPEFQEICESIHDDGENIDLLIITHLDEDHLGGALYAMGDKKLSYISEACMNYDKNVESNMSVNVQLSSKQNIELYQRMTNRNILVKPAIQGTSYLLGGAQIDIIWPPQKVAQATYCEQSQSPLAYQSDYGQSLEKLGEAVIRRKDKSQSNRASVVFIFCYEGKKLLFTGDAWGTDIVTALPPKITFDLIKLPHHGAVGNITEEWKDIRCKSFLVCTDGIAHPDKQTIAKILKWNEEINVYSPSEWWKCGFLMKEDKDKKTLQFFTTKNRAIEL
ncbi:MAG: MBL fold metallo-hydrolase [Lachnospiraceae bacterium]|nr:MBL fold metallo-hydrolase [Lachnospiraceae bacterium]